MVTHISPLLTHEAPKEKTDCPVAAPHPLTLLGERPSLGSSAICVPLLLLFQRVPSKKPAYSISTTFSVNATLRVTDNQPGEGYNFPQITWRMGMELPRERARL